MTRSEILEIMNHVMVKRGRTPINDESQSTREVNFRSLDFSEVALRIETKIDRELVFDAATMRRIETVKDVLDFFESVTKP
jgi:acyl carrier protein|tara:strand:- start:624 stop:866 length:243 start_codon:yes stop_codon:yes gene_type:complete